MDWISSDFSALRCTPDDNSAGVRKTGGQSTSGTEKSVRDGRDVTRRQEQPTTSRDENDDIIVMEQIPRKRTLSGTIQPKRRKFGFGRGELSALEEYEAKLKANSKGSNLWSDKYQPKIKSDLAVNKRKIAEVEEWLKNLRNGTRRRILVLTGPPGAGKSTTVRLLARELRVDVRDLENPVTAAYNPGEDNSSYETVPSMFLHFLCSAKYGTACRRDGSQQAGSSSASNGFCSVALIEEIPDCFVRSPAKLVEILNRFTGEGRTGIVFIISESNSSNLRFWSLFPPHTISKLGITVIKFNPIVESSLKKNFLAVAKKEIPGSTNAMTQEKLDELISHCRGDIRAGLTALEFSIDSQRTKTKGSKSTLNLGLDTSRRDQSIALFRAVGRVFYVKRRDDQPFNQIGLPPHLMLEARRPLTYIPEEIMDKCATSPGNYIAFVHENYPHFVSDMDLLERAADAFSLASYVTSEWTEGSQDRLEACAASVTVRGLLQLQRAVVANKAHVICKPAATEARKKCDERKAQCLSLFLDTSLGPPPSRTSVFFAETIPYWGKISSLIGPTGSILKDMSVITTSSSARTRLHEDEWCETAFSRKSGRRSTVPPPVKNEIAEIDLQFSDIFDDDIDPFSTDPQPSNSSNSNPTNLYDTSQIQIEEAEDQ